VVAFFLILIVYIIKARTEEKLLTGQLGDAYQEYKMRTGMLIPWVG
jgi:protein-S-isoprenylcysteine O-methyltransferase Ste14